MSIIPTIQGPLDYHRAADFIEAVRQLGIEHGYLLARGVQHVDEPRGMPLLRFEVLQAQPVPLPESPSSITITEEILVDLGEPGAFERRSLELFIGKVEDSLHDPQWLATLCKSQREACNLPKK